MVTPPEGKVERPSLLGKNHWTVLWKGVIGKDLRLRMIEVIERQSSSCAQRLVQQIVGRERRERVSQLTWCGEGCFDSRRRVNSDVVRFLVQMEKLNGSYY
jgi:hypothetical protein